MNWRKRIPALLIACAMLTVIYGFGYILNILINGKGGRYPNNNDFYFFLRWGWGVAILIFAGIISVSFGIACLLSLFNSKAHPEKESEST